MRLGLTVCVFALAVCCGAATTHKTRLVALAPTVGPDRKLEWLKVQYEANKGTDSVGIEHYLGEEATDRLGGFADVSFAYGTPQQSCRLDGTGDRLFCLGRTNASTVRGASSDRLRLPCPACS